MAGSWWRRLAQQLSSSSSTQDRRRRRKRADFYRPRLEALEERALFAVRIWDGGAAFNNNNWSAASNWVGNVAPVANDELVFPEIGVGPLDRLPHNDFPLGTNFNKITIGGNNYTLTGNQITIGSGGLLLQPDRSLAGTVVSTIKFDIMLTGRSNMADVRLGAAQTSILILEGRLSGAGTLIKSGDGDLTYKGTASNTNTGETRVQEGRLFLQKAQGVTAIAGPLEVGDGIGGLHADRVISTNADAISSTVPITVKSSGLLQFSFNSPTIGPLTLIGGTVTTNVVSFDVLTLGGTVTTLPSTVPATIAGSIVNLGSSTRIMDIADGPAVHDLVITCQIVGDSSGLIKRGPGTLLVDGINVALPNTYGQPTIVQSGTLLLNDTQTNSPIIVEGGVLGGNGTVGRVNMNGGTINPGASVGLLTVNTLSTVTTPNSFIPSSFVFEASSFLNFDLLKVTGVDSLGISLDLSRNPILNVQLGGGGSPAVGTPIKLIDIAAGRPPALGVFRSPQGLLLNEGSPLTVNGLAFVISYRGGDGNDVVLIRDDPPAFQNRSVTPFLQEGGMATLKGRITEPNAGDTFFLDVNWGDGSPLQTFTFPPGSPRDVTVTHKYQDDNPSVTSQDRYTIHLLWRDQHGGSNTGTLPIVVRNVAPSLSNLTFSSPVVQRQLATLSGLISDPGVRDTFKLLVVWGDGSRPETLNFPAGTTSFSLTHRFTRSGNHPIALLLTDDDNGVNVSTTRVKVNQSAAASRFASLDSRKEDDAVPLSPAVVNALFAQEPLAFEPLNRGRKR